ncbi:acyltransferase [Bacillus sp. C1]
MHTLIKYLKRIKFYFFIKLINLIPFTRFYRFKRFLLIQAGVQCGINVRIGGKLKISTDNVSFGDNIWIGNNTTIYNSGYSMVIFGDNIDIAPNCTFCTGSHEIGSQIQRAGKGYTKDIKICSGTWVGINTTILAGVEVGKANIISAGTILTKSTEENSLVGGVPGKMIKKL